MCFHLRFRVGTPTNVCNYNLKLFCDKRNNTILSYDQEILITKTSFILLESFQKIVRVFNYYMFMKMRFWSVPKYRSQSVCYVRVWVVFLVGLEFKNQHFLYFTFGTKVWRNTTGKNYKTENARMAGRQTSKTLKNWSLVSVGSFLKKWWHSIISILVSLKSF